MADTDIVMLRLVLARGFSLQRGACIDPAPHDHRSVGIARSLPQFEQEPARQSA